MCSQCPQKTIWDRPDGLDWNSQPPELKALGKASAERIWLHQMETVMHEVTEKLKWEEENLPPEEVAKRNAQRRALIEEVVANSNEIKQAKEKRGRR